MKMKNIIGFLLLLFTLNSQVILAQVVAEPQEAIEPPPPAAPAVEEQVYSDEAADYDDVSVNEDVADYETEKSLVNESKAKINKASQEKVDEGTWKKTVAAKDFKYEHPDVKQKKKKKSEDKKPIKKPTFERLDSKLIDDIGNVLFYIIIAAALCLVLYAIFGVDFLTKSDKKIANPVNVDFEDVEHFTEWDKARLKAEGEQDYRTAIRILYNESLQKLAEKNLIQYSKEATNSKYVQALYSTDYYKEFFNLTRIFDYVWYGEYKIHEEKYVAARNDFKNLIQRIS